MTPWLRHHVHSLADAVRRLVRAPLGSAIAVVMIGAGVALPLAGVVALDNGRALGTRLAGEPQISVFLANDAGRADLDRVGALLRESKAAKRVVFVPKDEALADLKRSAALGDAVGTLRANPLPDAFVVSLSTRSPEAAETLAALARADAKVAHVQLDSAWLRRLDAILGAGRVAVGWLAALLAVGLAAVAFGVIRTEIAGRRDEIEVARLVGATEGWVRRPFLYTGALLGLLGAAAGIGFVLAGAALLRPAIMAIASSYGSEYSLSMPPAMVWLAVLGAAAGLGVVGAALAARTVRMAR